METTEIILGILLGIVAIRGEFTAIKASENRELIREICQCFREWADALKRRGEK